MPELRRDPVTGRWVIISTDRQKRPNDFRIERTTTIGRAHCPFCPGRESLTPPEVLSARQNGSQPNTPGWDVRVVPNKFPALKVEGALDRRGEGMFDRMNGLGAHEVIIETPDHDRTMAAMSEQEIERVLWAYRERILEWKQSPPSLRFRPRSGETSRISRNGSSCTSAVLKATNIRRSLSRSPKAFTAFRADSW